MGRKSLLTILAVFAAATMVIAVSSGVAEQKPTVAKSCSLPGCHTPQDKVLRGNAGGVSAKAETIQINTGVVWTVKFSDATKIANWDKPINKIPRNKEIAITYTEKDGQLYAIAIAVKPPVKVPPEKLLNVEDMKRFLAEGKALIIDARPAPRYHEGHIPGAINIWDAEFDKNINKLPKEKDALIVYYCAGPT
ncbi:rhodanese-like domain-containing protein [Dissulfurispira thermophila]|nr:rhodanese-like domain-containing protein [Dissulfurispira thermophila]